MDRCPARRGRGPGEPRILPLLSYCQPRLPLSLLRGHRWAGKWVWVRHAHSCYGKVVPGQARVGRGACGRRIWRWVGYFRATSPIEAHSGLQPGLLASRIGGDWNEQTRQAEIRHVEAAKIDARPSRSGPQQGGRTGQSTLARVETRLPGDHAGSLPTSELGRSQTYSTVSSVALLPGLIRFEWAMDGAFWMRVRWRLGADASKDARRLGATSWC